MPTVKWMHCLISAKLDVAVDKMKSIPLLHLLQETDSRLNASVSLIPVLMFLRHRAINKKLVPKIKTETLIQLVQNAGAITFNYEMLEDMAANNQAVMNLINSSDRKYTVLQTGQENVLDASEETAPKDDEADKKEKSQEIVSKMAKKAAK